MGNRTTLCGCGRICGDDGDTDGPGTCKGLPLPKPEPLVEIVLVDATCPIHGVAAFIRSLPDDLDDDVEFPVIGDGFDEI